jgi:hypothetical protein
VDGALTLWSPQEVAAMAGRGSIPYIDIWISPALSGTPLVNGESGSFVQRTRYIVQNNYLWDDEEGTSRTLAGSSIVGFINETAYVPGGGQGGKETFEQFIQKTIDTTVTDTLTILDSSEKCREAIARRYVPREDLNNYLLIGNPNFGKPWGTDPQHSLRYLHSKGQIKYNSNEGDSPRESHTLSRGTNAVISLEREMFYNTRNGGKAQSLNLPNNEMLDLNLPAYRVMILLHELSHATGRYDDTSGILGKLRANLQGYQQSTGSSEGTNKIIKDNCLDAVTQYFSKKK